MAEDLPEPLPEEEAVPFAEPLNEALPMGEFFAQYADRSEQPASYQAPAMNIAEFHADKANGKNNAYLDLSMVNQGVVAVFKIL